MGTISIQSGSWQPSGIYPSRFVADSYYYVQAEQRYVLQDIVRLSEDWYWNRPSGYLFQSAAEISGVTDARSSCHGSKLIKAEPITYFEDLMLKFCHIKF